jgi:hypothetical protein
VEPRDERVVINLVTWTSWIEIRIRTDDLYKSNVALIGIVKLWGPTFKPLTWAFGGGDGIRTHGLYIANV